MKKIFLLAFLVPVLSFAQNYKSLDSLQFVKAIDQILAETGKKFELMEKNDPGDDHPYLKYAETSDNKNRLLIAFNTHREGANIDFDRPGIKKWNITKVIGKLTVVFPIWQKYYQTDADIEKISKDDRASTKDHKNTLKRYEKVFWELTL